MGAGEESRLSLGLSPVSPPPPSPPGTTPYTPGGGWVGRAAPGREGSGSILTSRPDLPTVCLRPYLRTSCSLQTYPQTKIRQHFTNIVSTRLLSSWVNIDISQLSPCVATHVDTSRKPRTYFSLFIKTSSSNP